ncbi:MAG: hypothetical protein AB1705_05720 [Verrucomicrobiota bacterium]
MDRQAGSEQIRQACKNIAVELMKIHPAVPALKDDETQKAIYEAIYELTKQVEIIKKRVGKLEKRDETPEM